MLTGPTQGGSTGNSYVCHAVPHLLLYNIEVRGPMWWSMQAANAWQATKLGAKWLLVYITAVWLNMASSRLCSTQSNGGLHVEAMSLHNGDGSISWQDSMACLCHAISRLFNMLQTCYCCSSASVAGGWLLLLANIISHAWLVYNLHLCPLL